VNLSRPWFLGVGAASFVIVCSGCHESSRAQPNAVAPARSVHSADPVTANSVEPPSAGSAILPTPPVASAAAPMANSAESPSAAVSERETEPPLLDEHGKPLDQTDQRPTQTSASFQKRIELVAQAILTGEVEPALPAFFPLVAYQQVKDVAKPERDYKFRLLANFKRDLLEYHHALGAAAAETKFDGVTVSEKDAKWMAPGSEGNKLGYFRVLRSRLRFTLPTGRSREFELTSLISWRGEWYVVHLHGFK
jgi:hypothetical protein